MSKLWKAVVLVETLLLVALSGYAILQMQENQTVRLENHALSAEIKQLQASLSFLNESYAQLTNQSAHVYRKLWVSLNSNLVLEPGETMAISLFINAPEGNWGVMGLDLIEVKWVNVYSPQISDGRIGTAIVGQSFDDRRFGDFAIAFPHSPSNYPSWKGYSAPGTTISFFYDNWNYIRTDHWMRIDLQYRPERAGGVYPSLHISELELYVIGWIDIKLEDLKKTDFAWISYEAELQILKPNYYNG